MLRGMATVSYFADDLDAAARWYGELLGVEPYYRFPHDGPPAYIEFRVGDQQDELGIIDRRYAPHGRAARPGGEIVFWHVDDLPATVDRLLERGATVHDPITEREAGFATASVLDPFGNILGVMVNPHYLRMLPSAQTSSTAEIR